MRRLQNRKRVAARVNERVDAGGAPGIFVLARRSSQVECPCAGLLERASSVGGRACVVGVSRAQAVSSRWFAQALLYAMVR